MSEVANCKEEAASDASNSETIINVPEWRVLHRVPQRRRENKKDIFDPVVVSLGPYHYGQNPEFRLGEQVKDQICDVVYRDMDKGRLLTVIKERVHEIRHFYSDRAEQYSFSNDKLCDMMLRDACFVLCNMDIMGQNRYVLSTILECVLGMSGSLLMIEDIYKLENQIPLWLIQMLFSLLYGGGKLEFRKFLCDYFRKTLLEDGVKMQLIWEEGEPLHLVEASYRISLGDPVPSEQGRQPKPGLQPTSSSFGSVRYLKEKGIHLGPSSDFLREIRFSSFFFYGKLQLPMLSVNTFTNIFLSNVIALEMSPGTHTDFSVTSYVVFMKALIEEAKDAKELRDKGILSGTQVYVSK